MFGLVAGDIVPIVAVRLRSGLCFVVVSERLQHWPCCGARTDFFWRKLNPKETKPGGGDATNGFAANAIDTGSAVVANGSFLLLVLAWSVSRLRPVPRENDAHKRMYHAKTDDVPFRFWVPIRLELSSRRWETSSSPSGGCCWQI